jgi:DNA replication protein DnaC
MAARVRELMAQPPEQNAPGCGTCEDAGYVRRKGKEHFGLAYPCPDCWGRAQERRFDELWGLSGIPDHLRDRTFDAYRPATKLLGQLKDAVSKWSLEAIDGGGMAGKPWLVLVSGVGTGKTHLAIAAAQILMQAGRPSRFENVPSWLTTLRQTQRPGAETQLDDLLHPAKHWPVFILDDLGVERRTPFAADIVYEVLNTRAMRGMVTIVTTNVPLEEFEPRIESRLSDVRMSQVFSFQAPDFRKGTQG